MKAAKLRGQGQIGPDKRPCSLENFWAIPRRAFPYWRVPHPSLPSSEAW